MTLLIKRYLNKYLYAQEESWNIIENKARDWLKINFITETEKFDLIID